MNCKWSSDVFSCAMYKLSNNCSLKLGFMCLMNAHVQFLGSTEVEQPKGTEVVRDAVRKLKVRKTPRRIASVSISCK